MTPQPPRRSQPRLRRCREKLQIYLLWIFLGGIVVASCVWGSCTAVPTVPPSTTPFVPHPRCRVVLNRSTINVQVVIRRDCVKLGVTTVMFVILNPADEGLAASEDAIRIMTKFFGTPPELSPMLVTKTPAGHAAFLFVAISFPTETENKIRRDMWLRQHHRHR